MGLDLHRRSPGYLAGRTLGLIQDAFDRTRRDAYHREMWLWRLSDTPVLGWRIMWDAYNALPAGTIKARTDAVLGLICRDLPAVTGPLDKSDVSIGYMHQMAMLHSGRLDLAVPTWTSADLRRWREARGWTQAQLADDFGLSPRHVARLEEPDAQIDPLLELRCREMDAVASVSA